MVEAEEMSSARQKRYSNWAEHKSVYDLVSPYSSRIKDVAKFQRHEAFIWGSKVGVADLHVREAGWWSL